MLQQAKIIKFPIIILFIKKSYWKQAKTSNRSLAYVIGVYQLSKRMIFFFREDNKIMIMNDGKGIPVAMHKEHDMYVPTLIFGHLLTSSNYDDSQKKVFRIPHGNFYSSTNTSWRWRVL